VSVSVSGTVSGSVTLSVAVSVTVPVSVAVSVTATALAPPRLRASLAVRGGGGASPSRGGSRRAAQDSTSPLTPSPALGPLVSTLGAQRHGLGVWVGVGLPGPGRSFAVGLNAPHPQPLTLNCPLHPSRRVRVRLPLRRRRLRLGATPGDENGGLLSAVHRRVPPGGRERRRSRHLLRVATLPRARAEHLTEFATPRDTPGVRRRSRSRSPCQQR
jgi:hypothetical protein